mmetsp:Transcript_15625/g.40080  ORF Transcript_15625/g.40080 Transcript_15625/m.40080 type:complete len:246 (-) Transcript_15625:388-1125(-)
MKARKSEEMRLRRPSIVLGDRPRLRRSASRSTSSTISRVRLQSNSLTVHLTCSSTSNRSSVVSSGRLRPLYSWPSSLERVVNGVCTCTVAPLARSHFLGELMSLSVFSMRIALFSALAAILRRSMVCSSLVSLVSSCLSASARASSGSPAPLILDVSCRRHASSSLYRISKSAAVRGCMRLWISYCRLAASSSRRFSSCSRRKSSRSSFCLRRSFARRRASQPRTRHWMITVFCSFSLSSSSAVM